MIWTQVINFSFIWPDKLLPVLQSPAQCLIAKSNLSFLWCGVSLGLFFLTTAFIPAFFRPFWIVGVEMGWLTTSLRALVTWTAFSALPEPIRQIAWWMLVSESFVVQPPEDFWRLRQCLEWILEMVTLETPVWDEIWWLERPESRRERICAAVQVSMIWWWYGVVQQVVMVYLLLFKC